MHATCVGLLSCDSCARRNVEMLALSNEVNAAWEKYQADYPESKVTFTLFLAAYFGELVE